MNIYETAISVLCAVVSLVATIIIAIVQYRQGKRMENLASCQAKEEERRRKQKIKAQRDSFIMKYYNDNREIYLLPLCWTASHYNSALSYHRKMYMEYNMLENDVQKAICDYMNFHVSSSMYGEEFYDACAKIIHQKEKEYTTKLPATYIFYDNAKYLENCIKDHKCEYLPNNIYELEMEAIKVLHAFMDDKEKCQNPIQKFSQANKFHICNEKNACIVAAVAAKEIAQCNADSFHENNYWIPGSYGGEQLETFEDLFLCVLFCIYVDLILPSDKGDNNA